MAAPAIDRLRVGVGILLAFCNRRHRCLHDLVFGSEVVLERAGPIRPGVLWSGLIGGMFLALAYFGCDQSQVQRYLTGKSVAQSRLSLIFNAVAKIPMQFFILFIGAIVFVFFIFERPPLLFNPVSLQRLQTSDHFYYMCTKYFADGDVHKYFNPYESPYDSYINLMNVMDNVRSRAKAHKREREPQSRHNGSIL